MGGGGAGASRGDVIQAGGVRPMEVAGRVAVERERLSGMNEFERAWRKKWLSDQVCLTEPRYVDKAYKEMLNPLRRFYRFPLDFVFKKFVGPFTGQENAMIVRFYVGRILLGLWGAYGIFYYFKYNTATWKSHSGWRVITNKPAVFPGDPNYPVPSVLKPPHEYNDRGFKDSIFAKQFPQYQKKD